MKASRVHAVVAAGLANPRLLAEWRREPAALGPYGIEPDDLDLSALFKFAGLAAKIRHAGLRQDLPGTFRLLSLTGLEIELFASLASSRMHGDGDFASGTEARTEDLLTFLDGWIDRERRDHALVWDLIRHEATLARFRRLGRETSQEAPPPPRPRARFGTRIIPRIRGEISLLEMRCDPRRLASMLQAETPRLEEMELGSFHFGYWSDGGSRDVHILELDELGFYLLSFIDGVCPTRELGRRLGVGARSFPRVLDALRELARLGIVTGDSAEAW